MDLQREGPVSLLRFLRAVYHGRYLAETEESLNGQDVEGESMGLTIRDNREARNFPGPTTEKPSPGQLCRKIDYMQICKGTLLFASAFQENPGTL